MEPGLSQLEVPKFVSDNGRRMESAVIGAAIALAGFAGVRLALLGVGVDPTPLKVTGRIDPNQAPWHELVVLPGIGESRAKSITAHRARLQQETGLSAPYDSPSSLDAVPGIGEKTIQRIQGELSFPVLED